MSALETLELTLPQLNRKMIDAADAIDKALDELREKNSEWVDEELAHRYARAMARPRLTAKLVADREDELFLSTRTEWFKSEMAKALRDTAKEALRARMAVLSGLQWVARAHSEEARSTTWSQERSDPGAIELAAITGRG